MPCEGIHISCSFVPRRIVQGCEDIHMHGVLLDHAESTMDPLSDVLSLLQVEDAAVGRIEAGGHWALQGSKAKHVVFCALLDGPCWLIPDNTEQPIRMEVGDCFAVSNGASFRLCSD